MTKKATQKEDLRRSLLQHARRDETVNETTA